MDYIDCDNDPTLTCDGCRACDGSRDVVYKDGVDSFGPPPVRELAPVVDLSSITLVEARRDLALIEAAATFAEGGRYGRRPWWGGVIHLAAIAGYAKTKAELVSLGKRAADWAAGPVPADVSEAFVRMAGLLFRAARGMA